MSNGNEIKTSNNSNDLHDIVLIALILMTTIVSSVLLINLLFEGKQTGFMPKIIIVIGCLTGSSLLVLLIDEILFEITKVIIGEYVVKINNKKHVKRLETKTTGRISSLEEVDYYYIYVEIDNRNVELSVSKEQYDLLFENDEVLIQKYVSKLKFFGDEEKFKFMKRCS